jgi:hypothetical protein
LASSPVRARVANDLTREDKGRSLFPADRIDELESPVAMADVIGVPPAETALPRAEPVSRRGAFEPVSANVSKQELRAAIVGDYRAVFAAFAALDRFDEEAERIRRHGELIASLVRTTTPRWYDNWTAVALSPQRPPPIFPANGRT